MYMLILTGSMREEFIGKLGCDSNDAKLEIDFLIQHGSEIVPIEAKAEENLRAKSLSTFVASRPEMHGLRFSMSDYREQDWMTNVPLYAVATYF